MRANKPFNKNYNFYNFGLKIVEKMKNKDF